MSNYTTGEMAKLCNVSVRTVQFYDTKGILHPSDLTEGGRRIYNDDDLRSFRLICTLKAIGLSLNSIKSVLESELSGKILTTLLNEQVRLLSEEVEERQKQLEMINLIKESISDTAIIPANTILGIEDIMEKKRKTQGRRKLTLVHIAVAVGCVLQTAFLGWLIHLAITGKWWPISVYLALGVLGIIIALINLKDKEYICPKCEMVFKPSLWRAFFTTGNNKVRWTKCPDCGHRDWCVLSKQRADKGG